MLGDDLKIFVHGLPLDCEEHSLKDFLEGKVHAKELKGETLKYFFQIIFFPYPRKSAMNEPSELPITDTVTHRHSFNQIEYNLGQCIIYRFSQG